MVLTLEGAVAVRRVHKLSADRKWDTEFMSRVKGVLWNFKANAGDNIIDCGIPERVDACPPDPPIEIPPVWCVWSVWCVFVVCVVCVVAVCAP